MHLHSIFRHVEGHIRGVQEIIGEKFFDEVALISQADNEVIDAVARVNFEDMPENWFSADLDHRLWTNCGLFAETGSQAPRQDNCLHLGEFSLRALRLRAESSLVPDARN